MKAKGIKLIQRLLDEGLAQVDDEGQVEYACFSYNDERRRPVEIVEAPRVRVDVGVNGKRSTWKEATMAAVIRQVESSGKSSVTIIDLAQIELPRIIEETRSNAKDKRAQLQRALRDLVSDKKLTSSQQGVYTLV